MYIGLKNGIAWIFYWKLSLFFLLLPSLLPVLIYTLIQFAIKKSITSVDDCEEKKKFVYEFYTMIHIEHYFIKLSSFQYP